MDPKNALLRRRGQELAKVRKALGRGADGTGVADEELLAGVGPPADLGGTGGQDARQAALEQAVGQRGDVKAGANASEERRNQLRAPVAFRVEPGGARGGRRGERIGDAVRSEEHTSELQSHVNLVCRLLLEKKKKKK